MFGNEEKKECYNNCTECNECQAPNSPFSTIRHLCLSFGYLVLSLSLSARFFLILEQLDLKYNLENSTIKYFLEMSKTTDATHNKPKRQKPNTQTQQNYNILFVCSVHAFRTNTHSFEYNISIFRTFGWSSEGKIRRQNDTNMIIMCWPKIDGALLPLRPTTAQRIPISISLRTHFKGCSMVAPCRGRTMTSRIYDAIQAHQHFLVRITIYLIKYRADPMQRERHQFISNNKCIFRIQRFDKNRMLDIKKHAIRWSFD